MADIFKFPNGGYDITVCRKQDIIDALDANVIDKEVVLAIITQCEVDATNFLKEGRWTGIPYLGNMRIPKSRQKFKEIKGKEILEAAKEELDRNRYILFRKQLNSDIAADVKRERFYRYMTSTFVTKHRRVYDHFLEHKNIEHFNCKEAYARFMCYSLIDLNSYRYFG